MTSIEQQPKLRIFMVEDCADCASSLAIVLRLFGHEVRTFANGADALNTIQNDQPDVMLLDIGLPGMNGFDVAKQIRRHDGFAERPYLIAITGFGQDSDRQLSAEAGIDLHLVKPVEARQLNDILGEVRKSRFRTCQRQGNPNADGQINSPVGSDTLAPP